MEADLAFTKRSAPLNHSKDSCKKRGQCADTLPTCFDRARRRGETAPPPRRARRNHEPTQGEREGTRARQGHGRCRPLPRTQRESPLSFLFRLSAALNLVSSPPLPGARLRPVPANVTRDLPRVRPRAQWHHWRLLFKRTRQPVRLAGAPNGSATRNRQKQLPVASRLAQK